LDVQRKGGQAHEHFQERGFDAVRPLKGRRLLTALAIRPIRRTSQRLSLTIAAFAASVAAAATPVAIPFPLPLGTTNAGFDDINFSTALNRVIVPAGRSGKLFLIDPATGAMETVEGFGGTPPPGSRGGGTTSAGEGAGYVFAINRSNRTLVAVDPATRTIRCSVTLSGGPDIVRYVAPTGEVWVTEPHDGKIEIFSFTISGGPKLAHVAEMAVPEDAPEALVVDAARHRLYTNQESGTTFGVDPAARTFVSSWPIGCGPRGLAIDEKAGFLFVACEEGVAVVLDLNHGGKELGRITVGAGIDLFDYSAPLHHLYLPGSQSKTMAIVGVSAAGALTLLGTVPTAERAHACATDGWGRVWVTDSMHGQLLLVHDPYPASVNRK